MIPKVDKDTCIGCGLCPSICPEVFEMQDDGKAGTIVDEVPSEVEDNARRPRHCPCKRHRNRIKAKDNPFKGYLFYLFSMLRYVVALMVDGLLLPCGFRMAS